MTLQQRYVALHILYFLAVASLNGFSAIFLSWRGLDASLIGVATGGACLLSVAVSILLSNLTARFSRISLQTFLNAVLAVSASLYGFMAFLPLPAFGLVLAYILCMSIPTAMAPLLAQICMSWMEEGKAVNFGKARGMGSVSYATGVLVLNTLARFLAPWILAVTFVLASLLFYLVSAKTPAVFAAPKEKDRKESPVRFIQSYPLYLCILVSFMLFFMAASPLSVYLVNIMESTGGSASLYGLAVFLMAASELPFMSLTDRLVAKYGMKSCLAMAGTLYLARNVLVATAPSVPVLFVGLMLQGASYGLLTPLVTRYAGQYLAKSDQIFGQSLVAIFTTGIGSTLGNFVGGQMIAAGGLAPLRGFCLFVSVSGALLLLCGLLVSVRKRVVRLALR